jgi:hypothetical protein
MIYEIFGYKLVILGVGTTHSERLFIQPLFSIGWFLACYRLALDSLWVVSTSGKHLISYNNRTKCLFSKALANLNPLHCNSRPLELERVS